MAGENGDSLGNDSSNDDSESKMADQGIAEAGLQKVEEVGVLISR